MPKHVYQSPAIIQKVNCKLCHKPLGKEFTYYQKEDWPVAYEVHPECHKYWTNTIFTVTTMHEKDNRYGGSPRNVAWYTTIEKATEIIEDNICDIHEEVYTYAIIEELTMGLYPMVVKEIWYEWFGDECGGERYEKIDKPDKFKRVIGWSIG